MAVNAPLPTLYEFYTSGGITSGLSVEKPYFTLNNKNITIYSGAMHYFRVPKPYWRDRLRKIRACGLNTVETYVPWNLHEPQINHYDFGNGNSDMTKFLNIEEFLKMAQEEDLLVLVRPGPYICSEWEFGGLPSWLLREKNVKVRTSDPNYMKHVTRYFTVLLQILATLQFTKGGPIIGFQIENEYGSTARKSFIPDKNYLKQLRQLMVDNEIVELLFTSDSPITYGDAGTLPSLFQTANFMNDPEQNFDKLKTFQKNKPAMAMEFWSGWFDHWSEKHHIGDKKKFHDVLERILKYPASVNLYMFHGGTNWGFLNGANIPDNGIDNTNYQPDTTSYDYDAPLNEAGDYTEKYYIVKELLEKYNNIKTQLPPLPKETSKTRYSRIPADMQLSYEEITGHLPETFNHENVVRMEMLQINNNSGQSYGYIIYRKKLDISPNSTLKLQGQVYDMALILVNNKLISPSSIDFEQFGFWRLKNGTIILPEQFNATLDIVVLNMGRNNFGSLEQFKQFKGLRDSVYLNDEELKDWEIMPMEFKTAWTNSLIGWHNSDFTRKVALYKAVLNVDVPMDTFIDMSDWTMGIVVVNGFVLGRYLQVGPQQTLYLPATLLHKGGNDIVIFEHFAPATHVSFSNKPIFCNIPIGK